MTINRLASTPGLPHAANFFRHFCQKISRIDVPRLSAHWLFPHFTLFILLMSIEVDVIAQDEGTLVKHSRVAKSKVAFLEGGLSLPFGKSTGDYMSGFNFGAGYLHRETSVISFGPFVAFNKLNYDSLYSNSFKDPGAKGNNYFTETGGYEAWVTYLEGGDLSLISAGAILKVNFIPVDDNTRFTVFGTIRPHALISQRAEIKARSLQYWLDESTQAPKDWTLSGESVVLHPGSPGREKWAAKTEFSAGIDAGVGAQLMTTSGLGFYIQALISTTLPITHINTSEFPSTLEDGYNNPDYPLSKKSFSSAKISIGIDYIF